MLFGNPVGNDFHHGLLSLLSNIGLQNLAARDVKTYISTAENLAGDVDLLRDLRNDLRTMMLDSPLMDGRRFASDFEALVRLAWRRLCNRQ